MRLSAARGGASFRAEVASSAEIPAVPAAKPAGANSPRTSPEPRVVALELVEAGADDLLPMGGDVHEQRNARIPTESIARATRRRSSTRRTRPIGKPMKMVKPAIAPSAAVSNLTEPPT